MWSSLNNVLSYKKWKHTYGEYLTLRYRTVPHYEQKILLRDITRCKLGAKPVQFAYFLLWYWSKSGRDGREASAERMASESRGGSVSRDRRSPYSQTRDELLLRRQRDQDIYEDLKSNPHIDLDQLIQVPSWMTECEYIWRGYFTRLWLRVPIKLNNRF